MVNYSSARGEIFSREESLSLQSSLGDQSSTTWEMAWPAGRHGRYHWRGDECQARIAALTEGVHGLRKHLSNKTKVFLGFLIDLCNEIVANNHGISC